MTFTDGIIAIIVTLLVLQLVVPTGIHVHEFIDPKC
ncbi:TMEM175 family protein [Furfurilactobacillus milii]